MKHFISVFCLLLLLLLALPARAQDAFLDALPGLAGGYGEQADTAARLGTLADPRALPILSAMSEGRLRKLPDGTLVLPDDTNPATGQPVDATAAEPVRLNNRVRQALRGAIGQLQILSPDPEARRGAADAVFRTRSAANVPLLETALARETVPEIRAAAGVGAGRLPACRG